MFGFTVEQVSYLPLLFPSAQTERRVALSRYFCWREDGLMWVVPGTVSQGLRTAGQNVYTVIISFSL